MVSQHPAKVSNRKVVRVRVAAVPRYPRANLYVVVLFKLIALQLKHIFPPLLISNFPP